MSLALLAPLGLLALLALGIPLLLHLVRRSQLIDTPFAALRWIPAHVQPRRRLRVERPWLLLLRLLLLALLAVLLARLVLTREPAAPGGDWVVVAPGADVAAARTQVAGPARWRWLAPGFPPLDATGAPGATATASLLRELDANLPTDARLRVVVPHTLAGLDGASLQLGHAVDWIVVAGTSPVAPPDAATAQIVHVRHDAAATPALDWLRAAVAAWNVLEPARYTLDAQPLAAGLPAAPGWLLWLGRSPPPAALERWIERGGVALVAPAQDAAATPLWRDADGRVLAASRALGAGRLITLPTALAPHELPWLPDARFPLQLLAALRGPLPAPTRAIASAVAPTRASALPAGGAGAAPRDTQALDGWLAWAGALLFVLERLLATRRRAEAQA